MDQALSQTLPRLEHVIHLGDSGNLNLRMTLTTEQVAEFVADPVAMVESLTGVPYGTWLAWRDAAGQPPCSASTVRGLPCKGRVPGVRLMTPKAWENYGGGYCGAHEGF